MPAVPVEGLPGTARDVLDPAATRAVVPDMPPDAAPWVYRYRDAATGWQLSIATLAEPSSDKLSLGGFRIAPESRTSLPGWDADREAIGLGLGMEEKVYWSRVLAVGGPRAAAARGRIVGGKCVLHPTADARVGQPRDRALLDWAIACFLDMERTSGVHLTTGQDLGHGTMADGATASLDYLNARFPGSVGADTSIPTAQGNFHLLCGMLQGAGIAPASARVGLVGVGHIGRHMLAQLRGLGTEVLACEMSAASRDALTTEGIRCWPPEEKAAFLDEPMDAVVVNAAGGSLDLSSIARITRNRRVRVVCGSENLAMPDPRGTEVLLAAQQVFCPTELGGMMGYLTAVEEYLSKRAGERFRIETVLDASRRLEEIGRRVMEAVVECGYSQSFEDAARSVYGE